MRFSELTSELIQFNHFRCHSSSTALGTRNGYWKPTRRGTDETPLYARKGRWCKRKNQNKLKVTKKDLTLDPLTYLPYIFISGKTVDFSVTKCYFCNSPFHIFMILHFLKANLMKRNHWILKYLVIYIVLLYCFLLVGVPPVPAICPPNDGDAARWR